MAGTIEKWNRKRLISEGWIRLALRPKNKEEGRDLIYRFKLWFPENGKAQTMYHVVDHAYYSIIAFSDMSDCVIFRLTFPEISANVINQPMSDGTEFL